MMSKRYSSTHILLVRSQSFIPNYFSPSEFQTTQNKSDCDSNSEETPAYINENESTYHADYYYDGQQTLNTDLCGGEASFHSLLQFLASYNQIYEIQTTRLRSSALASLFSCNVSKMTSESKAKLNCDGYFGCPEEKQFAKDNATFPRRRRPVCIIPWKKRPSIINKKKKSNTKPPKPKNNPRPDSTDAYYVTKVDCVTSTLERTKVSGIKLRIRPKVPSQTQSTKSHPAMFYSYFVSKGCQYRKACVPKRRSCDGFFGCHDGDDCCKDGKGKRKGKKALTNT